MPAQDPACVLLFVGGLVGLLLSLGRTTARRQMATLRALGAELQEATFRPGFWLNADGAQVEGRLDGRTVRCCVFSRGGRTPQLLTRHEVLLENGLPAFSLEVVDALKGFWNPRWEREVRVEHGQRASERLFQARSARPLVERLLAVPGVGQVDFRPDGIAVVGWIDGLDAARAVLRTLVDLAALCERRAVAGRERPAFEWLDAGAARCPYCHDALGEVELEACDRCGTLHHAPCLAEAGGCTVLGCRPLADRPREKG
jgi:hypothetical protein